MAIKLADLPESVKRNLSENADRAGELGFPIGEYAVFGITTDGDTVEIKSTPITKENLETIRAPLDRLIFHKEEGWHARTQTEIAEEQYSGAGHVHIGLNEAFRNGDCRLDINLLKRFMLDFAMHGKCFESKYSDVYNAPFMHTMKKKVIQDFVTMVKDGGIDSMDKLISSYQKIAQDGSFNCQNKQSGYFDSCHKYMAITLKNSKGGAGNPEAIDPNGTVEIRALPALGSAEEYLDLYKMITDRINFLRSNPDKPAGDEAALVSAIERQKGKVVDPCASYKVGAAPLVVPTRLEAGPPSAPEGSGADTSPRSSAETQVGGEATQEGTTKSTGQ